MPKKLQRLQSGRRFILATNVLDIDELTDDDVVV